ncbi:uncharacterized protein BBA_08496 [Beauveria bassiana ARSEF 2860]|uniref:Uncharacterized protein n=1 Tax=Beauveria bassiana (strain ARSEF 2860) TaxID=655819 RepID=J4VVW3_BEAB2|nr:uncharacterized protein BBA_08496 [Beauveria bassiana ARSEF 2860]EJP62585.1 hypothetical protein BBA_08496 [Beauveria bassiana ARSEF 2860]
MFHAMGVDGGGSLVAGVATLLSVYPFVFSRYGGEEHPKSYDDADLQQHQSNH